MARQPGPYFAKNPGGVGILGFSNAIVNPFTIAASGNHTGAFQVSEMPGNLWLIDFQNLDKETNTHLVFANEIDQSQTCPVCQCPEEKSDVFFVVCHAVFAGLPVVKYYDSELLRVPFSTRIYRYFRAEIYAENGGNSIRILLPNPLLLIMVSIYSGQLASALQQRCVTPDTSQLANAFATPHFAKATRFV